MHNKSFIDEIHHDGDISKFQWKINTRAKSKRSRKTSFSRKQACFRSPSHSQKKSSSRAGFYEAFAVPRTVTIGTYRFTCTWRERLVKLNREKNVFSSLLPLCITIAPPSKFQRGQFTETYATSCAVEILLVRFPVHPHNFRYVLGNILCTRLYVHDRLPASYFRSKHSSKWKSRIEFTIGWMEIMMYDLGLHLRDQGWVAMDFVFFFFLFFFREKSFFFSFFLFFFVGKEMKRKFVIKY